MEEKSFLYVVRQGDDGPFKVGISNDPQKRLFGLQTGNPDKLTMVGTYEGTRGRVCAWEKMVHYILRQHRINGEWFSPVPFVVDYLKSLYTDEHELCTHMGDRFEHAWDDINDAYHAFQRVGQAARESGDYDVCEYVLREIGELIRDIGGEDGVQYMAQRLNSGQH